MQSIDYNLNIFKVQIADGSVRRLYMKLLSGRIYAGTAGIAVYKVKGDEWFENVPETGDEKYETGGPWSKYWEDVTGVIWPTKCQRVGCACEGKDDAVGGMFG